MTWQTTYPTTAAVDQAAFDTLSTWAGQLPPPTDDLQRSIHRRIQRRMLAHALDQLQRQRPDLAAQLRDVLTRAAKLGIKVPRP